MRHLDLFSGIGGFALAASWVWVDEHEIVSFVEIDPFCQKVLKKHWPDVPIQEEVGVYKHDGTKIDIITGGYPCQPFSTASHGRIVAKDLSQRMLAVIETVQPKYIIAENVQRKTIEQFAKRLPYDTYSATVRNIAAYGIGADHIRNRWFCIAYPHDKSELPMQIHAEVERVQSLQSDLWAYANYAGTLRVHNGIPYRMDRLRCLGNAIVPQVVVPIMAAIKRIEEGK